MNPQKELLWSLWLIAFLIVLAGRYRAEVQQTGGDLTVTYA